MRCLSPQPPQQEIEPFVELTVTLRYPAGSALQSSEDGTKITIIQHEGSQFHSHSHSQQTHSQEGRTEACTLECRLFLSLQAACVALCVLFDCQVENPPEFPQEACWESRGY